MRNSGPSPSISAATERFNRVGSLKVPCVVVIVLHLLVPGVLLAEPALLKESCAECHNPEKDRGDFRLDLLGDDPTEENLDHWLDCLDLVLAEEMPPEDDKAITRLDRERLIAYLDSKIDSFAAASEREHTTPSRRLNNREFANSIRDVLMIEDVGTHLPTDNLVGDSLHHGFDTHGETLGFSLFHLEQYVEAVRRILDGVILTGERPESKTYRVAPDQIFARSISQNSNRPDTPGTGEFFDFHDPRRLAYCEPFEDVPETGYYRVRIRATGKDRLLYDSEQTGLYEGDPIQMEVRMGDRTRTYNLPDEEVLQIELEEWLVEGSRLEFRNPTDGLKEKGNGNFKFQYAIAGIHDKKYRPRLYDERAEYFQNDEKRNPKHRANVDTWHNWREFWEGPRPRILGIEIEGPIYKSWPPSRQVDLIGKDPKAVQAAEILRPIAERAWRRPVREGELEPIVAMVRDKADSMGDVGALKEGIVAILVSPSFLLLHTDGLDGRDRFASKVSYFFESTSPSDKLRDRVAAGELDTFDLVRRHIEQRIDEHGAEEFLREFPFAWLELNDINFMSPDPDQYRFYHRKNVSDDMVEEVRHFFRYAVENNIPVIEFLSADYSFINQDLARIYGVEDEVPRDSRFRKFVFRDGRRGGLLGMAAFLTATADSLSTSPIHRAVYVMENLMGIHPTPPPPDVEITEPDVRQAKTIKEVLEAHVSDQTCAGCHQSIDPWGYAFENFDPTGAWRDSYTIPVAVVKGDEDADLPSEVVYRKTTPPVDASARFRSGRKYRDIVAYRKLLVSDANRDRFVRCFVTKLLTYANGVEPCEADFAAVNDILARSAESGHRIIDTIAAVVDSPLFRN